MGMSRISTPRARSLPGFGALALIAATIAGCGSDKAGNNGFELPGMHAMPAPTAPAPAPTNLGGRWTLLSAGRGQCGMTLGFTPNATEGTIAPEGGCPGQFFTSRKWTYETS